MSKLRLTPHSIMLWMIGLSLMARLFSPYAVGIGTMCLVMFWIPILVLLPELVNKYDLTITTLKQLPKITLITLSVCLILIVISFFYRRIIFDKDSTQIIGLIRKSLYLMPSFICISWLPMISMKRYFLIIIFSLNLAIFSVLAVPGFLDQIWVGQALNELTCIFSAVFFSWVQSTPFSIDGSYIYGDTWSIGIGSGCSSTPQILISFFSILIFYICSKINSKRKLSFVLFLSAITAFFFNSIRISILAFIVSMDKMKTFDFWHEGAGSLIFSLIIMTISSAIYYKIWISEHPEFNQENLSQ